MAFVCFWLLQDKKKWLKTFGSAETPPPFWKNTIKKKKFSFDGFPKVFVINCLNASSQVLWPLVRFPLRWPISRPSFSRTFFSCQDFFRHFAHCYFVLNFSLSAQKQHILVFRNTPNCSSVHSGMTGISLAELALHNRCDLFLFALFELCFGCFTCFIVQAKFSSNKAL